MRLRTNNDDEVVIAVGVTETLPALKRGMVVKVNREASKPDSHIISGPRPAIIVNNQKACDHSPVLNVIYLTTSLSRLEMNTHVLLQDYEGLRLSQAKAETIESVDRDDIMSVYTTLRPEDMVRVDRALKRALGLEVADE